MCTFGSGNRRVAPTFFFKQQIGTYSVSRRDGLGRSFEWKQPLEKFACRVFTFVALSDGFSFGGVAVVFFSFFRYIITHRPTFLSQVYGDDKLHKFH